MSDELPQVYLLTPMSFDLETFTASLSSVLDAHPIACVRLRIASEDERTISLAADTLRECCHERDVPLVIETHVNLVPRLGLDGVHLNDGPASVRKARKSLGADAVVGTHCNTSRHAGISAGEAGADYVAFGPTNATTLGSGEIADRALFEWWSEMIEVPVVAEGALDIPTVEALAPVTDFFAFGDEIWNSDTPEKAVADLIRAMG